MPPKFVLVTGATGFIGAHIVDTLLSRGIKVRGATRSLAKGDAMIKARPQYAGQLEFVEIGDFEKPSGLLEAVGGVDGVIHTASVSHVPRRENYLKLTDTRSECKAIHIRHNKQ
jgi:uncharacterized protein YbjT (DUF2867 family)